jgi:hypothetical protein
MKSVVTLLTVAAAGIAAFYIIRRIESRNMRKKIASEGFETATDVLYPDRRRSFSKYRIGPILPQ